MNFESEKSEAFAAFQNLRSKHFNFGGGISIRDQKDEKKFYYVAQPKDGSNVCMRTLYSNEDEPLDCSLAVTKLWSPYGDMKEKMVVIHSHSVYGKWAASLKQTLVLTDINITWISKKEEDGKFCAHDFIQLACARDLDDVAASLQFGNASSVLVVGHGLQVYAKSVCDAKMELMAFEEMLKLEFLKRSTIGNR